MNIFSDKKIFHSLILHLLENAFQNSKIDDQIILNVEEFSSQNYYLFQIIDKGIGISDKLQFLLNTNPLRLNTLNLNQKPNERGLGLFLCNNFIRKLGSQEQIHIESTPYQGTKVSFLVYKDICQHKSDYHHKINQDNFLQSLDLIIFNNISTYDKITDSPKLNKPKVFKTSKLLSSTNQECMHTPEPSAFNRNTGKKKKSVQFKQDTFIKSFNVIIAVQNSYNRIMIEVFFSQIQNCNIITKLVNNSEELLDQFTQKNHPDGSDPLNLIFMDCNMNEKTNYNLVKTIKQMISLENFQKVIVVGYINDQGMDYDQLCKQHDMEHIMYKPLNAQNFEKFIQNKLNLRFKN